MLNMNCGQYRCFSLLFQTQRTSFHRTSLSRPLAAVLPAEVREQGARAGPRH